MPAYGFEGGFFRGMGDDCLIIDVIKRRYDRKTEKKQRI
jgi:hypothetical protein